MWYWRDNRRIRRKISHLATVPAAVHLTAWVMLLPAKDVRLQSSVTALYKTTHLKLCQNRKNCFVSWRNSQYWSISVRGCAVLMFTGTTGRSAWIGAACHEGIVAAHIAGYYVRWLFCVVFLKYAGTGSIKQLKVNTDNRISISWRKLTHVSWNVVQRIDACVQRDWCLCSEGLKTTATYFYKHVFVFYVCWDIKYMCRCVKETRRGESKRKIWLRKAVLQKK